MRFLQVLLLCLPLLAQTPAPPAEPAATAAPTAAAAPAVAVESPVTPESGISGSVEVGYRFIPSINGSSSAYRSIVNLGEGPKLLNADFTILPASHKYFDRIDVHAGSWGGDPYNTLRIDAKKESAYRLNVDYRNIAYFNFLPSFADPLTARGSLLDWNSFDTHIRTFDAMLELTPGRKYTPYLAFSHNSQYGGGISSFVSDANQYAVATSTSDETNNYRAGVRIDLWRGHLMLEEGGSTFKDDQGESNALANPGYLATPFNGRRLTLNNLGLGYAVRGHSYYSKAVIGISPFQWMTVSGDFIFAQPSTTTKFSDLATGTLYSSALLQFFTSQQDLLTADARMPHSSGSLNVELRPWSKIRIVNFLMTDRFHNAAGALLTQTLLAGTNATNLSDLSSDRMAMNYNQEEVDVFYDVTSHITLRGGYRYVWGDTLVRSELNPTPYETGNLRRNVGIGGVTYRLAQKLRVIADFEASKADQVYFRTSLRNYQKARIRASYDLTSDWRFTGDFTLLNNSDPDPQIRYDFRSRTESVSAFWNPKGGKDFSLLLDYTRSSIHSDILYLVPQDQTSLFSNYRDNGHTGTAIGTYRWFSAGGSFYKSAGTRPTAYYQPLARVSIPINKHVAVNAEWRWYGFSEAYYGYENFTSHQFTTSVRFTK